jgi:hypothetical protein
MNNILRRLRAAWIMWWFGTPDPEPQTLLPQYHLFFKKRYGISVWSAGDDVLIKKPDGSVTRILDAHSYVELFDAIERIGKAL